MTQGVVQNFNSLRGVRIDVPVLAAEKGSVGVAVLDHLGLLRGLRKAVEHNFSRQHSSANGIRRIPCALLLNYRRAMHTTAASSGAAMALERIHAVAGVRREPNMETPRPVHITSRMSSYSTWMFSVPRIRSSTLRPSSR